jgi:hypothetical protein
MEITTVAGLPEVVTPMRDVWDRELRNATLLPNCLDRSGERFRARLCVRVRLAPS